MISKEVNIRDFSLTIEEIELAEDILMEPELLHEVKDASMEFLTYLVSKLPSILAFVPKQNEEMCEIAMQLDGEQLKYVRKQTDLICKLAVRNKWQALAYVRHQTEEICKIAVDIDGNALQFVRNQTPEIRRLAVAKTPSAIKYATEQDILTCIEAVSHGGDAISYLEEQPPELCKIALAQNGDVSLPYIRDMETFQEFLYGQESDIEELLEEYYEEPDGFMALGYAEDLKASIASNPKSTNKLRNLQF